jgi:hypothetical protein
MKMKRKISRESHTNRVWHHSLQVLWRLGQLRRQALNRQHATLDGLHQLRTARAIFASQSEIEMKKIRREN